MVKSSLILIGAGGHANSCIDVIEQQGHYQIGGLVGLPEQLHSLHLGYTVIGNDGDLMELARKYQYALIAIGQIQTADHRIRLYQKIIQLGFKLPTIISPTAYVSRHAMIGEGTIVMSGAIVNAGAKVGNNCIINSQALVEHDVTINNHCHISTGVMLNGGVKIEEGCFIGSGSVIREGVSLGRNCVVGMGLSVRRDLVENARFIGR